eukprot:TRINITY_DN4803_c0_g1_i2.p1 TRINITY_DN4803_c0_g1~~TRINITY_DN4803_c0_g1_i2.p1  ORF type:complete len:206 (-),score=60.62 TRINITY_DN4803_c0_g1_i2:96-683(-)
MSLVPLTLRDPFWDDPHFANARGEFDEMRKKMMKEAKDFWSKAEEDSFPSMGSLGSELSPAAGLPRWVLPRADSSWPSSFTKTDSQVIKIKEDADKFEVALDCTGYRPEELKVSTLPDNVIVVEGRHEEKQEQGAQGKDSKSSVVQQFSRKYSLPAGCDPQNVVSNLSRDGVLIVTAPKMAALAGEGMSVPILHK